MLDGVSLDQLRTFIAAADEGSFSAAGRRLRRAQSVVSQTLANLEGQLGVKLFDRSARFPVLTDQGRALLADARAVAGNVDLFKARAKSLAGGLEPELSVAVDVMFPPAPFTAAVAAFQKEFPVNPVEVRCRVERRGRARARRALRCRRGGVLGARAAAAHPRTAADGQGSHGRLAAAPAGNAPRADSGSRPRRAHPARTRRPCGSLASQGFGLQSARLWRLSHLGAKLAFLRAGLGFGVMPLHMIEADLASGALVQIRLEDAPAEGYVIAMSAIYRTDNPPGPAGRWFIDCLKQEEATQPKGKVPALPHSTAKRQNLSSRRSLTKRRARSH